MLNPIRIAASVFNSYVNFWDKTSTTGKVCVHALTLFAAIAVRLAVKVTERNIVQTYEMAGLTALITHLFAATLVGNDLGFRTKKS